MIFASLSVIILFTCWAYHRAIIRKEADAWVDIERVALLIVVFLVLLYGILHYW